MPQIRSMRQTTLWLWLYLKRPKVSSSVDASNPLFEADSGFTLIEVLVAMIVAAVFVSMTMQAIVTSAAFRVVATQYDEAVSWIQEDLETVVNQAAQYEITTQPYSSRCLATLSSDGFASGFLNDSVTGLGGASATIGPRALGGKYYTLTRTANYTSSSDPYRLLNITYQVTEQGGSKPIAIVNTEVIPHAVFKCP
ncbi:type II secretion system protein J [Acaryochloris sp. CCMEE 5410]|uniref:PulJ/GspJ family protein n=1 Tax=Acaryochloris sp. CCMEE 5410 TaxID=310037 RepID=UPI0002484EAA|nr:prepilin-type N-terminal cleavage/methylation domain-containing protein [Acaryochloris sp. CCMEE 5410]KAI9129175.1 prepilin-type N-terminal cleavage/methylation domain-containing protein [Acaryochloris sp. CCMEE 5410]